MRLKFLRLIFVVFFVCLSACLFYIQIVRGHVYKELSSRNSIRLLNIRAPRGIIYDRDGRVLARDALSFGIFIVPQEAEDPDAEIRKVAELLRVPESLLKRNYKRNYQAPFAPCEIIRNVPKEKAILIEELKLDMQGVLVKEIPLRSYPYGEATSHVLGYVREIGKRELASLERYGYSARDLIGKDGIEKVADATLRGRDGGMQVQVDNRGRQVKVLSYKMPEKGHDIQLTIDAELQKFLWMTMRGKKGAAVFLDIKRGDVLAMVSTPSYDAAESIGKFLTDKDKPLLNRAIMGLYPPGSLFKVVAAAAGLDLGKISEWTTFTCTGRLKVGLGTFHCWKRDGHGTVSVKQAITESCNVFFYNLGLALGVEKLNEYAKKFGLGRITGIEMPGEQEGLVPSRGWKKNHTGDSWYAGDTVNFSIGQGYLLVTPLQVARIFAAIANGGKLVKPHLLKKLSGKDMKVPKPLYLGLDENITDILKKAAQGVVNDDNGTGIRAWNETVSISGKTGTAQAGADRNTHAWFAGFVPSDEPEMSFAVFLEHGGSGSDIPALITRKVMEFYYGR